MKQFLRGDENNEKSSQPVAIDFSDWGYRRAAQQNFVLRHFSCHIPAGQHVLIMGASGIGKSTIMEAIAGLIGSQPGTSDEDGGTTEGSVSVGGFPASSRQARALSALMLQDPMSQAVLQRVGDNVAFGLENEGVPRCQIWPRVTHALRQVGLGDLELNRQTAHLSGGQMQRVALAGALCMNPGVLLLDEPTANLDPSGARSVVQAITDVVRARPTTLVLVDHRAEKWLGLIDRVIILGAHTTADGHKTTAVVADGPADEVFASHLDFDALGIWVPTRYAAGRRQHHEIALFRSQSRADHPHRDESAHPISVKITDAAVGRHGKPILTHVSCAFRAGEVSVLEGENGVGKSTLALTLAGLLPVISGHVATSPSVSSPLTSSDPTQWPSAQLARRVSYVFQSPEHQFVTSTVLAEAMVGLKVAGKSPDQAREQALALLDDFGLRAQADRSPYALSGGQKRRLTVVCALAAAPKVVILDEPTFGQDRTTWWQMTRLIRRIARQGTAVIVITHDHELVEALADHTITLGYTRDADLVARPQTERRERVRPASLSPIIARLNPASRLLGVLLLSVPIVLSLDIVSASVFFVLVAIALCAFRLAPPTIFRHSWPVWVAAPWSFLAVLLYGKPGGAVYWSWGWMHVTQRSAVLSVATVLRLLASTVPAVLFLIGIDSTDLADALTQIVHLPDRFVYGGLAGTRLITVLSDDWQALTQARRSRGIGGQNKLTRFVPQAFALLVLSIRRSTQLATAMQARGFGGSTPRSHARVSVWRVQDGWFIVGCVCVPVVALLVSALTGSFAFLGGR